jgi:hypothetical protein
MLTPISEAYATLIDTAKRTEHDVFLANSEATTPTWQTSVYSPVEPHPSWPTDIDMDDAGLLAAYANILVDAYTLHTADATRRLPMLAGVPPSLFVLLATGSEILLNIPEERPGKELLAGIVHMAEEEVERALDNDILRKEEEKLQRRRRSSFRPNLQVATHAPSPLVQDQAAALAALGLGRRSSSQPSSRQSSGGVRELGAIAATENRRLSRDSMASTRKVTFEDQMRPRDTPQVTPQVVPQPLPEVVEAVIPLPTEPKLPLVHDSHDDDDGMSDMTASTCGTFRSAIDWNALNESIDEELPSFVLSTPVEVAEMPGPKRADSWLTRARPGAKAPTKLIIPTEGVQPASGSEELVASPEALEDDETATLAPPSPTSSTATRRPLSSIIGDKVKLADRIKKPFTPKFGRSRSLLVATDEKKGNKRSTSDSPSRSADVARAPRKVYAPVSDEDFNFITRRPLSPPCRRGAPILGGDPECLRILHTRVTPSRFLENPHGVMDEVVSRQGTRPVGRPPPRRAPTLLRTQSMVPSMSSGDDSSVHSPSIASLSPRPISLSRVSTTSSTHSTQSVFYVNHASPFAPTRAPPEHAPPKRTRNLSSQSLDHHQPPRLTSRPSTSSLPAVPVRRESFFKRASDPPAGSRSSGPKIKPRRIHLRVAHRPSMTSPVLEVTENSTVYDSDSEREDIRLDLPTLEHTSSLTDSAEQLSTPSSMGGHKPLPAVSPRRPSSLSSGVMFGKLIPLNDGYASSNSSTSQVSLERQRQVSARSTTSIVFADPFPPPAPRVPSSSSDGRTHRRTGSCPSAVYGPPPSILVTPRTSMARTASATSAASRKSSTPSVFVTPPTPGKGQLEYWLGKRGKAKGAKEVKGKEKKGENEHEDEAETGSSRYRAADTRSLASLKIRGVRRITRIFRKPRHGLADYEMAKASSTEWQTQTTF